MKRIWLLCALFAAIIGVASGQEEESGKLIQIDGFTYDETGAIIPNVSIYSKHLQRGAASDVRGIFSIISAPGDTVFFSAIGFKSTLLTVPAVLSATNYATDVKMFSDTIIIGEVLVLPWKSYSEFKRAVLKKEPQDPLEYNMNYNLALVEEQIWADLKSTPGQGYRYTVQQMTDNLYTKGQMPYNNLLNPVAWTRFIKELKTGLLKNEETKKNTNVRAKVRKKKTRD